jgi:hypothetical protein
MIVPMLLKVDFGALHQVAEQWRGIAVTVGINWLVKPFSMAVLGSFFIGWLFRPWLPAAQIDSYIAGLILPAAAPCTAMVFVWSNLTDGEPNSTLTQVALNDTIMVFSASMREARRRPELCRGRRCRGARSALGGPSKPRDSPCLAGKIQGNSSILLSDIRISHRKHD